MYAGRWYQVWQRSVALSRPVLAAMPLGNSLDPTAVPDCRALTRLARATPSNGLLAASALGSPRVISVPSPLPDGNTHASFVVTAPGTYEVWLAGSFFRRLQTSVDRSPAASSYEQLNEAGEWTPLLKARLSNGPHRVTLSYGDAALYPGSGGPGPAGPVFGTGPLAVAPVSTNLPITYVPPDHARALCGRRWDWIESLGARRNG
jgi:hypothetical protein